METFSYLVPDYYPHFHCKMGDCRNACCQGWPVSIDREKYFRLLGAECPPELRQKLDCAMYLCDYPTPQRYAQLNHRFDGNCALRDPDGRCGLQVAMGEDILPDVCRLYPRGIHGEGDRRECSCSNSCEAVPELFWNRKEPLGFQKLSLPLKPPAVFACGCEEKKEARSQAERLTLLALLQDRSRPLSQRIQGLGEALGEPSLPFPSPSAQQRLHSLEQLVQAIALTEAHSDSLHEYAPELLARWNEADDPLALYQQGQSAWEALCPQWEVFFEHLLVNHLFFLGFPAEEDGEPAQQQQALCLLYAMLRFLLALLCLSEPSQAKAVDLISALFRLVAHTDFSRYAGRLLRQLELDREDCQRLLTL